jgi:hypothetical protein
MEIAYEPVSETMRSRALQMGGELGLYAVGVIGCFTLSGFFNGLAGSSLTTKLRAEGIAALLRQDMSFFDKEENSSARALRVERAGRTHLHSQNRPSKIRRR